MSVASARLAVDHMLSPNRQPCSADCPSQRPAPLLFQAFSHPISADCDVIG